MESISIQPYNVARIARFILTLQPTHLLKEHHAQWLENKQYLQEALDQFLDPKALLPGETVIDYMDRSLSTLVKCVRHVLNQLSAQQIQQLLATATPA